MNKNELSIEINKPIDVVFEFTVNPNNTHKWIDSIIKEERSSENVGIGTIYKNTDESGNETSYRVSEYEQNKLFELEEIGKDYKVRYTYESVGSGDVTKMTYVEWVSPGNNLESPFYMSVLEKLKVMLEQ